MIKYSNFLFLIIFRKASTYISAFFCLLATFIFIYLNVVSNNNEGDVGIFPITLFSTWFPFVFSTVFAALMVIRIFKIGENDGTELLISAKPITRGQIIFGKFLVLFTMILILHGLLFILYITLALIDDEASGKWRILFATSMTLGGLIVTIISTSLIVIISSIISKVGVAIISIIFSSCIPIASFLIIPAADAISPTIMNETLKNNSLGNLYLMNKDKNDLYNPKEKIYSKGYNILKNKHLLIINQNKNSWYKYGSLADIWYQWGRLYSMFEPEIRPNLVLGIIAKKVSVDIKDQNDQNNQNLFIKEHGIKLPKYKYDKTDSFYREPYILPLFSKKDIELEKEKVKFKNNDTSKYQNLVKEGGKLDELLAVNDEDWGKNFIRDLGLEDDAIWDNPWLLRIFLFRLVLNFQKNNPDQELKHLNNILPYMVNNASVGSNWKVKQMKYEKHQFPQEGHTVIRNYKEEPWLATIPVVLVWSFLALGLAGLSILIYFKRDFR